MVSTAISDYLATTPHEQIHAGFLAYIAALSEVSSVAPSMARTIVQELDDQRSNLKLIASENYCSLPTQLAMGNLLTDKYAEGYAGHRFYAGCDNVDDIERYGSEQAKQLFGCAHAYLQPHSGADANLIAFWAILNTRVQVPALKELGCRTRTGAPYAKKWVINGCWGWITIPAVTSRTDIVTTFPRRCSIATRTASIKRRGCSITMQSSNRHRRSNR